MKNSKTYFKLVLSGILGLSLISCDSKNDTGWEFAPNMYNSLGYEAQTQIEDNAINPNGMNMRYPVAGTVSRRNYKTSFVQDDSTVINDLMIYGLGKDDLASRRLLKIRFLGLRLWRKKERFCMNVIVSIVMERVEPVMERLLPNTKVFQTTLPMLIKI